MTDLATIKNKVDTATKGWRKDDLCLTLEEAWLLLAYIELQAKERAA